MLFGLSKKKNFFLYELTQIKNVIRLDYYKNLIKKKKNILLA